MTTQTETAISALVAALKTASEADGSKLVAPLRNEDIVSRLVQVTDTLSAFLNVWDTAGDDRDEMLGADIASGNRYDITQRVRIEFAVAGGSSGDREARWDDMRKAIWDAIKGAVSGDDVVFLGGAVDGIRLDRIEVPGDGHPTDGLPNIKAGAMIVALSFTSADPF